MENRCPYKPLVERNLENVLVEHLARRFDFGKDSRVARLLVCEILERLEHVDCFSNTRANHSFCPCSDTTTWNPCQRERPSQRPAGLWKLAA
jgi:hypothetical protein